MHLLIPFAGASSEPARQALAGLQLPHLARLLARSQAAPLDAGDEYSLTPPHERALGRALGWQADDGRWPFAAWAAASESVAAAAGTPVGWLTPTHWAVGSDQVTLLDPEQLALEPHESQALMAAAQPLFADAGWTLHWAAATRWYGMHPDLATLPTAALDRVIGRGVDPWMPDAAAARPLRRLQSEVQMLWHRHPVNEAREARGAPVVNSFWLSGCGALPAGWTPPQTVPELRPDLRAAALAGDWSAWAVAWQALDAGLMQQLLVAARHAEVSLTVCGERHAQRLDTQVTRWWQSWRPARSNAAVQQWLGSL